MSGLTPVTPSQKSLDINQVKAEWGNSDPRIKRILESLPKLTEDAKLGKLDKREVEEHNDTLQCVLDSANDLASKIFVLQAALRLIDMSEISGEKHEGNVGILKEWLQSKEYLQGGAIPQHILDLLRDPGCVSCAATTIFGLPADNSQSAPKNSLLSSCEESDFSDSEESAEDLALLRDEAIDVVNHIALRMKGFVLAIGKDNHADMWKDLKEIKKNMEAFKAYDLIKVTMAPHLPKEVIQKFDKTLGKIKLARKVCMQLKYNSRDPDPRLETVLKKAGLITVNSLKMEVCANVAKISLDRNPDQKAKDLEALILELQRKHGEKLAHIEKLVRNINAKLDSPELSLPEIIGNPHEFLNCIKRQAYLFYFERLFKYMYVSNSPNFAPVILSSTLINEPPDDFAILFFQEASAHLYEALTSNNLPSREALAAENHRSVSFFPSTKKENMYKDEFSAFFAQMLNPLMQVQSEKKLGIVGVFIEHEQDCLAISIYPKGDIGVFIPNKNLQGSFNLFESIDEGFPFLSAHLFQAGPAVRNVSWTPICKKELLGEVKKSPFGEIRFRCGIDPAQNTIHARGDEKSGLGGWKQETQALVLFDSATKEWVFSPPSNEGEFKFVLNGRDWEKGSNRDLSKPDPRPPRF